MAVALSRHRFTADEYQQMGHAGILREHDRVELIDGEVVEKVTIGPRHNGATTRLNHLFTARVGAEALVQVQGAVRLDPYSEPEPDVVLLRARADFYVSALPGPADLLLVVEVAERSLDYDRSVKADLYPRSGVAEYWLVDLNSRHVTRHLDPGDGGYRSVDVLRPGEPIAPSLLPSCVVTAEDLVGGEAPPV